MIILSWCAYPYQKDAQLFELVVFWKTLSNKDNPTTASAGCCEVS
jgi:hypothetical protein